MPDLIHEVDGALSTLKFNRKDVRNAINEEIMQGLSDALDSLEASRELRAVILTGMGEEAFCSGGDLKWLQSFESHEAGMGMSTRMQEILRRLSALPVPVIAVLNGYALGGGTEIAMACDMRVIEEHAYMSFKQARVGLMTGWGGGGRLLRTIGYGRALELLTTCKELSPEDALKMGLANAIVPKGDGLRVAKAMVKEISKSAPGAIRSLKELLLFGLENTLDETTGLESSLFADLWVSEDHDEAVKAFFEKRSPVFKGR
ncbi:MAG: enoyl-CoA hydratase/isomerase family protein [Nitrospinae bacterium]|nr:enoyl-CoA hydratase/isomerase family protein [Nitrospinota bacterium]